MVNSSKLHSDETLNKLKQEEKELSVEMKKMDKDAERLRKRFEKRKLWFLYLLIPGLLLLIISLLMISGDVTFDVSLSNFVFKLSAPIWSNTFVIGLTFLSIAFIIFQINQNWFDQLRLIEINLMVDQAGHLYAMKKTVSERRERLEKIVNERNRMHVALSVLEEMKERFGLENASTLDIIQIMKSEKLNKKDKKRYRVALNAINEVVALEMKKRALSPKLVGNSKRV